VRAAAGEESNLPVEKQDILFPNREHLPYLLPTWTEIRCITLLIWRHKSRAFSPLQGKIWMPECRVRLIPPSPSHRPERRFRSCFGRRCGWKIWPKKAKLVPASFAPATNGDGFSGWDAAGGFMLAKRSALSFAADSASFASFTRLFLDARKHQPRSLLSSSTFRQACETFAPNFECLSLFDYSRRSEGCGRPPICGAA